MNVRTVVARPVLGLVFASALLLATTTPGWAQWVPIKSRSSPRGTWEARVLRHGVPDGPPQLLRGQTDPLGDPWDPTTTATLTFEPELPPDVVLAAAEEEAEIIPPGEPLEPAPLEEGPLLEGFDPYADACAPACNDCGQPGGFCCAPGLGVVGTLCRLIGHPGPGRLMVFSGVQGFKGPTDQGRNGNFGFQLGSNLSGPLFRRLGVGYQIGFTVAQSDFSGHQTEGFLRASDRDQFYLTTGIFRRAAAGWWQWGVVVDYLHDNYLESADLAQIRSESALVLPGGREIGYWGAYGVTTDRFDRLRIGLEPTDLFAFFYRRRFSGGGQGRVWAGFTGQGDGLLGANASVPIGSSWSLENHFTYLVPKQGSNSGGQQEEAWNVAIRLVWYPGQCSRTALQTPYHPLFYVADNSVFMVDRD